MPSHHGMNEFGGLNAYCRPSHTGHRSDRFGRLCSDLAPLYTDPDILRAVGAENGPMDGGTGNNRTQSVSVGMVFFGQFVDHDITLDVTSSFDSINDADSIPNARTPTLDLDAVYGGGPEASPFLYHRSGPFMGIKLITGADTGGSAFADYDLPRVRADSPDLSDVALIGDPRNDENRIIGQIHLAMIRIHNKMVDRLAAQPNPPEGHDLYDAARHEVTWHYQWNVVHDFLVAMCGEGVVNRILSDGRMIYKPDEPFIPVEFAVAGFRFGHSMVPQNIQVQSGNAPLALFGPGLGGAFAAVPSANAGVDMHEIFLPMRVGTSNVRSGWTPIWREHCSTCPSSPPEGRHRWLRATFCAVKVSSSHRGRPSLGPLGVLMRRLRKSARRSAPRRVGH